MRGAATQLHIVIFAQPEALRCATNGIWGCKTCWVRCAGRAQSGTEALAEQRLRLLRSFRAAAAQLLNALLAHILRGLHGPSLHPVLMNIQVGCWSGLIVWVSLGKNASVDHTETLGTRSTVAYLPDWCCDTKFYLPYSVLAAT